MVNRINICTAIVLIMVSFSSAQVQKETTVFKTFEVAEVRFELNATDGDVEVVFEIKAGSEGLKELIVTSPDNRKVIDFKTSDKTAMGMRQFRFESPEPNDVNALKDAYPAGVYKFLAETVTGTKFYSESALSHHLPETVSFIYPEPEEIDVRIENLEIRWSPIKDIDSYIVEIDQEELGINILVTLPEQINRFIIPEELVQAGKEYIISIGTVSSDDNRSFVETTFVTALAE